MTGWLEQADGDPLVTSVTGSTATTGSTGRAGRVRRAGPGEPVRVHVWPGEVARPVLLALHTRLEGGAVFGPLAAALRRRWTVVAPDAPGHGGTRWTPSGVYTLDDQVPGALAVLDALPVVAGRRAPVVVLGHGTGAPAAASVAAARPRVVQHLVLEDPAGTVSRSRRTPVPQRRLVRRWQALPLADRVAAARAAHPDWPVDELVAWATAVGEVDPTALRVPTAWGVGLALRLAPVRAPVLLVLGDRARGAAVSAAGATRAAAACRGGCRVLAVDAGPDPRRQAREPYVGELAALLERYDEPVRKRSARSQPVRV